MQKGFIFDLDGTIYLGEKMIPGADEVIAYLKDRGDKVVFLTNKSISRRIDYVEKLCQMGIQVSLNEVINSNFITALYLKKQLRNGEKVFVIGEQALLDELDEQDVKVTDNPYDAKFVVLGWDRYFTYEKLNNAYQAYLHGAEVIATNPDRTCPVLDGEIPDCGAMIGAFEGTTGVPVQNIAGKPSKLMAEYVVHEVLKLKSEQCYMVGDRLETDIRMGNENGMNSVLVLTGITSLDDVAKASDQPKYILESVFDLKNLEQFKTEKIWSK
ncbi:HAD-IIA family hydrolase [Bacillus kwashiorkori]|uniref:HAD-IIA family hydrolase n=1 Tax=Bacillus kwashiorkori TaxID=1522318 RepID=UPI0007824DA1|nr:HAD-IIA family hydrolase [Bacillus kwashiorkori]